MQATPSDTDAGLSAATTLLRTLGRVLGPAVPPIPLHAPTLGKLERDALMACLDSEFVSSVGAYVDEFEARLRDFTGAKYAVVVVNGTAALQVALTLAGVRALDEVIVPALSFVATANAVCHCGAVPHFVDSAEATMGLDPAALDRHLSAVLEWSQGQPRNRLTGARVAAIVPMHTYGHPVNMSALLEVAGRHGIPIVEDAAESLGSTYQGQHTGTFGRLGTLSFNGNKLVTTGGGGAILTDDQELGTRAKHLTTTAKRPHRWEFDHDEVAWNYRMPNLNAALGCAQMERLPGMLEQKRRLAQRYRVAFDGCRQLRFVVEPPNTFSNYWLNTVQLTAPSLQARTETLAAVNDAGYQCRPTWRPLHQLPMFTKAPRAPLPIAESLALSLVNIPSSPHLATPVVR